MNKKKKYLRLKRRLKAFEPSLHFSGVGVGLRVIVTGRRHGAGALSVCGGSILFVVSPPPILVIPHHPSSSFPCHLPVVSPSSPHRYPLLSLHCSSLLSPCCPFLLIVPRTTTREQHETGAGSFVVDHLACLSCLGFQRATARGGVGPGSSSICNYRYQ